MSCLNINWNTSSQQMLFKVSKNFKLIVVHVIRITHFWVDADNLAAIQPPLQLNTLTRVIPHNCQLFIFYGWRALFCHFSLFTFRDYIHTISTWIIYTRLVMCLTQWMYLQKVIMIIFRILCRFVSINNYMFKIPLTEKFWGSISTKMEH